MNQRLRVGSARLFGVAGYLWYGWVFSLLLAAGALSFAIPGTTTALLTMAFLGSFIHPVLFFTKTRRELQGVEVVIGPDRYEIWRDGGLTASAPWAKVRGFESGLAYGWITLEDGERVPFYPVAEPSAAYAQTQKWLFRHEPLKGWMLFASRFRVPIAVLTVAGFVALSVGMPQRPRGSEADPTQTAVFGSLVLVVFLGMLMSAIGFAAKKAKSREVEPLALNEMLLTPGKYEDEKGQIVQVALNALIDSKGREFPALPTKTGVNEAGLFHIYQDGKEKLTIFPEKLRKLD